MYGKPLAYIPFAYNSNEMTGVYPSTATAIKQRSIANYNGGAFNGSSSVLMFANTNLLNGTGSHTISCFVQFNSLPTTGNQMMAMTKSSDNPSSANGIGMVLSCYNNAGVIKIYGAVVTTVPGLSQYTIYDTRTTQINKWYHLVVTFDNLAKRIRYYINNTLMGELATGSTLRAGNTSAIGAEGNGSYNWKSWLNGTIREAYVFNRALTATEVYKLYLDGLKNINIKKYRITSSGRTNYSQFFAFMN
jgi:hypothetical protein